jgi:hypothetical protein
VRALPSMRGMSVSVAPDGKVRSDPVMARPYLLGGLAALSVGVAVIHFAVTFSHFQEYELYGVFFLIISWAQLIWRAGLFWQPSHLWASRGAPQRSRLWEQLWLSLGIVGNAMVLAIYIASRTTGLPFGPDLHNTESVGALDVMCCVLEFALIAGCAALLWRPSLADRPVSRRGSVPAIAAALAVPALVIAATTAVMTPAWAGPEGPAGMASASGSGSGTSMPSSSGTSMPSASGTSMPSASTAAGMGDMGTTDGLPDMKMYGSTAPPTAAQVVAAAQLVQQTDATLAKYKNVQAAFAAGYTYVLRTNGEEHLLYDGDNPAYGGLDPQHPSSLVYAINVPHHAPILLGAMYIMNDQQNGPQIGGSLTRWHTHLTVCQNGKPTIAGFGVQLRGTCDPATWHDTYTSQMLHVWVVPYPGGVFSDDLSRAATDSAAQAALAAKSTSEVDIRSLRSR